MTHAFRTTVRAASAALALSASTFAQQAAAPAKPMPKAPPAGTTAPAAPAVPAVPPPPPAPPRAAGPAVKELKVEGAMPSAKDVLTKHLDAIGGAAAVGSHTSMRSTGGIEVAAAGLKGTMQMVAMAPNKVLMSMELPGMGAVRSGFDGTTGWSMDPMRGPSIMGAKETAELTREANFRRDLDLATDPKDAAVTGLFEFQGKPCWCVKVTNTGGTVTNNFYDRESGLMSGMSLKAVTPMGEVPVTVTLADWKDFGGVKVATKTTTSMMMGSQVMTIDAVEWDAVKPEAFELPAEIKALAAKPAAAPAGDVAPAAPAAPAEPAAPKAPAAPAPK
jgi:hypothetical protein